MKTNRIVRLLLLTLCISWMSGCHSEVPDGEAVTTEAPETEYTGENYDHLFPRLVSRNSWNIELEFVECTDTRIRINIIDHDNLGFFFNDLYYVLEYWDGDNWVKLSDMNEKATPHSSMECVPNTTLDYQTIPSSNMLAYLPDVTLVSGHYRLTKLINGRAFSVEFDLAFE